MRRKRIMIGIIFLLLALVACAFILKYFKGRNNKDEVVLSTAAGVIYEWNCKMVDDSIATVENVYEKNTQPKIDGGEIKIRYIIKGLKKGNTKFICNYSSPIEEYSVETNIYKVIVDKKLNVKIINNN